MPSVHKRTTIKQKPVYSHERQRAVQNNHACADRRTRREESLAWNVGTVVAGVIFMVDDEQNHTQEEADGAHGDVGDAEERVLPSHPGDGAQDHPLATVKATHRII